MILTEAYDYMDLLLDKADQPYFTTDEKDKFLNLAISDFINFHYQQMTADEDSRRALSGCIDWQNFNMSSATIIDGTAIYENRYPALSLVYADTTASDSKGYFAYGNQYVLPKQHLYVLSVGIGFYNKEEVINPSTGEVYSGVTADDIIAAPVISAKNKSTREHYEHAYTNDPFNKSDLDAPYWSYIENRMNFANSSAIKYINMQVITLPSPVQAFSASTYENSTAPASLTFAEHYQKQIIELAVEKMTRVDVGLMTPPS